MNLLIELLKAAIVVLGVLLMIGVYIIVNM